MFFWNSLAFSMIQWMLAIWSLVPLREHAKMGSIKDRNDMDLKKAEDIKKRWQEYTELYKKDLHDPDNCDGVITHLEPDILECKVQWALGSIAMNKASRRWWDSSWAISNPKRWCCERLHLVCQQIWKTRQWPQDWKRSVLIPIPKKGNAKECSNYHTIELISHASKVMVKFSKPGFNSMWTVNFQMFRLVLEKAEEPEIKVPHPLDYRKSKRVPEKRLFLLYSLCQSLWLCGSQ